jgi:hypothetical protein
MAYDRRCGIPGSHRQDFQHLWPTDAETGRPGRPDVHSAGADG